MNESLGGDDRENTGRTVVIHQTRNEKGKKLFCDNYISTTKYHWWNFVFKNLFEQFSRIANFYFLLTACILLFPWAPIASSTSFIPLAFVVLLSMIREGVEDILRWRADQKVNHASAHHLENGSWVEIKWKQVLVGDVLLVKKNEQIPADIVLMNSSEKEGVAYVDTCNLDGETNLKLKQGLPQTHGVMDAGSASQCHGLVCCDEPNNLLYSFNGYFDFNGNAVPLSNKQVILRGCVLRNTQWVIGVVVYTGKETKLMMNSTAVRPKKSAVEKGLNKKILSVFVFMALVSVISGAIGVWYETQYFNQEDVWYTYKTKDNSRNGAAAFFILVFSYLSLISSMVPISLYVTLEFVRIFQAAFISWDMEMYYVEEQTGASARTSNLSEDLGMIEYVFSDKTGTLTRNIMEFMKCSVAGKKYGSGVTEVAYAACKRRGIQCPEPDRVGKAFKDEEFMALTRNPTPEIRHFLWMLSTCHSVITEPDGTKPHGVAFQASSPDEGALVNAAADFGYVFTGRGHGYVTVNCQGKNENIEVLAMLEFSSERKRSSIVIRSPDTGKITLYCKGADDCIMSRLAGDDQLREVTTQHLKDFAADGLRTLCIAYREIDEAYFDDWKERYNQANCSIDKRDEMVESVADEIERDFHLLGATAIEDKLQIGVPETIEDLLKAGIRVWVITGDKRETAINIGYACSLLSSDMSLVILDNDDPLEISSTLCQGLARTGPMALIVSGQSLTIALKPEYQENFLALANKCKSVVCCRVSPYQKGQIVELVRKKTGQLTLAIGDGANDVGMILKADVGVGISGQEGRQAVMASDYAFGQFRFLRKLLLFHGRLDLIRNVNLINYCFYKNMTFTLAQFYYGFYCGFSAMTVYDGYLLACYNLFFTSIPPIIYAVFEKDVSSSGHQAIPELYLLDGKKQWLTSYWNFWISLAVGILHSFIGYFVPYLAMLPFIDQHGNSMGQGEFGITVYACVVIIVTARLGLLTLYWTWLMYLFVGISLVIYPIIAIIIDYAAFESSTIRGESVAILSAPQFWISLLATLVFSMIPSVAYFTVMNSLDTLTNKVMLADHHKAIAKRKAKGQEEVELDTVEPTHDEEQAQEERIGKYIDDQNQTGYQFAPPTSLYEASRFVPPKRPVYSAAQIRSHNRRRTVSTFSLDEQLELE